MRANSLALRLVISSAAWTLMILSVTAAILISLCRDFLEESFDQRLNQYLENIIAKTAPQGALDIRKPDDIGEPLFLRPLSGAYWQIRPADQGTEPLFKSDSLAGETYKTPSEIGIKPELEADSGGLHRWPGRADAARHRAGHRFRARE